MQAMRKATWLVAMMLAVAGCAAQQKPTYSKDAAKWQGRSLYTTPNAMIYASSVSAANEACEVVEKAAKECREVTGNPPEKVLIIVTDKNESLPFDEPTLYRLLARLKSSPAGVCSDDAQRDAAVATVREKDKHSLEPLSVLESNRLMAIPVFAKDLDAELHVPKDVAGGVRMGVLISTRSSIEETLEQHIKLTADRDKSSAWLARPVLRSMAKPQVVTALCRVRERTLVMMAVKPAPWPVW